MRKLYLRQCDIWKNGMSLGYIWDDSYYMCGEYCYQTALIDNALWFSDNEHFKNAEDKLEWVEEHEINFGEDTLVYAEEEDDWVVKETLITDDLEELLA